MMGSVGKPSDLKRKYTQHVKLYILFKTGTRSTEQGELLILVAFLNFTCQHCMCLTICRFMRY